MKNLEEIKSIIKAHKQEFFDKYEVQEIGIFGSYVRGEATEKSDLDILVQLKEDHNIDLFKFAGLGFYIEDLCNIKVDLVLKDGIKNALKKYILGEVIYL